MACRQIRNFSTALDAFKCALVECAIISRANNSRSVELLPFRWRLAESSSARPHISLAPLGKVANRPRSIQTTNSSALGQKYLADSSTRPSRLKHAPSYPKCSPIFDISLDFVLTGIWEIVKSVYSLPKSTILQSS